MRVDSEGIVWGLREQESSAVLLPGLQAYQQTLKCSLPSRVSPEMVRQRMQGTSVLGRTDRRGRVGSGSPFRARPNRPTLDGRGLCDDPQLGAGEVPRWSDISSTGV
jgi:hypothetical protein